MKSVKAFALLATSMATCCSGFTTPPYHYFVADGSGAAFAVGGDSKRIATTSTCAAYSNCDPSPTTTITSAPAASTTTTSPTPFTNRRTLLQGILSATVVSSVTISSRNNPAYAAEEAPSLPSTTNEAVASTATKAAAASPSPTADGMTTMTSSSLSQTTMALSQSLGHVLSIIDGLNAQAYRLSSSSSQSHLIAILDGMVNQSHRLIHELDTISLVLDNINNNAKEITTLKYYGNENNNDEMTNVNNFVSNKISHASSTLDGLFTQGKRLENAISSLLLASSEANEIVRRDSDVQIIHLLSILDGLNVQAYRLQYDISGSGSGNDNTIFAVLDEINAKATRALL